MEIWVRHQFVSRIFVAIASLVLLVGCDSRSEEAESTSKGLGSTSISSSESTSVQSFSWPIEPSTGWVRQVTKKAKDLDLQPSLILMSSLPGGQMPDRDITPLDVHRLSTQELEEEFQRGKWALVDVRKDADIAGKGTIPGSYHAEYKFEKAQYNGTTELTHRLIQRLLAQYDGIVFFCNGPKCPRSFNACVATAQYWGISSDRVRWYRDGVPAWQRTALIATPRELPTHVLEN